jgi:hypothetical protein
LPSGRLSTSVGFGSNPAAGPRLTNGSRGGGKRTLYFRSRSDTLAAGTVNRAKRGARSKRANGGPLCPRDVAAFSGMERHRKGRP